MIEATPVWFPFAQGTAGDTVTLLKLGEADYRAASFLDQRILTPASELREAGWAELALPAEARRDAQYIFHIGNVGSTLMSRLLGELPQVFALREPLLLRDFAAAPPAPAQFDALTALLSRTFRPGQRANVKATSFTSEIADSLVPPGSAALFLYATPGHYLENILAGENSWRTLAALSATRLERLQGRCPGLALDLASASDAIKAALGWACEMTSLERAAAALPEGAVLWMDFDRFLENPPAHFATVAGHFGVEADPAIAEGPLMRRYSKALDYDYSPALRRDILAAARRRHGPAIGGALDWLGGLESRYPALAAAIRRAGGLS